MARPHDPETQSVPDDVQELGTNRNLFGGADEPAGEPAIAPRPGFMPPDKAGFIFPLGVSKSSLPGPGHNSVPVEGEPVYAFPVDGRTENPAYVVGVDAQQAWLNAVNDFSLNAQAEIVFEHWKPRLAKRVAITWWCLDRCGEQDPGGLLKLLKMMGFPPKVCTRCVRLSHNHFYAPPKTSEIIDRLPQRALAPENASSNVRSSNKHQLKKAANELANIIGKIRDPQQIEDLFNEPALKTLTGILEYRSPKVSPNPDPANRQQLGDGATQNNAVEEEKPISLFERVDREVPLDERTTHAAAPIPRGADDIERLMLVLCTLERDDLHKFHIRTLLSAGLVHPSRRKRAAKIVEAAATLILEEYGK